MEGIFPHSFEQLIAWRTGLQMRQEDMGKWRAIINSRLSSAGLPSLAEYYQLLISDSGKSKSEWRELLAILTTGESYFFRDKGQFSLLKNLILPEIIERRQKDRTLRIWSAGCSTGEEPYSIAILIDELLPQLEGWEILILGTDINEKAIEKAKDGLYSQWSFRTTDPDLRKNYFKKRHEAWAIDEKIRKKVKFQQGNLMEDRFPDSASGIYDIDFILCRNVFIYFNSESVAVVLAKFSEALNDSGWLMTGHGELFGQNLGRLQAKMFPESVAYQKISDFGLRILDLKEARQERAEVKNELFRAKTEVSRPEVGKSKIQNPNSKIEKDSQRNNYIKMAQEYADTGQYDKAEAECRKALEVDKTAVRPYFLLAHIAEMKGNSEEAKTFLKRIIYLSPDFIPAYLELGALYERENDAERAKKMRTTAIELLNALPSGSVIEPYNEITIGELLEYVKKMVAGGRIL